MATLSAQRAFVGRQPIFDRDLEVAGYELLFRQGEQGYAAVEDADAATAAVVLNAFTELGLEEVVGSRPAWINVSRDFLLDGLVLTLPAERVMLELLEDQEVDDELLATLGDLRAAGYGVVLDDFVYDPSRAPLVRLADVVKLDVRALDRATVSAQVGLLRPFGATLVAEKVETHEELRFCQELGFDLFQGYFFCRPDVLSAPAVGPQKLALLQLVGALQDPAIEFATLETLITRDVGLSYRLLRYVNSAFYGMRREIDSIGRALVLLGLATVRRWATMSALASVEDKPRELIVTALVRARMCELLGASFDEPDSHRAFTLGLFSVVDALLDMPMPDVLARLPFPEDMVEALVDRRGRKGELLDCVVRSERGEPCDDDAVDPEVRLAALSWAAGAAGELLDEPARA